MHFHPVVDNRSRSIVFHTIIGYTPLVVKFEDLAESRHPAGFEYLMGFYMHPLFFRQPFVGCRVEVLQKPAKAHDVDQFMGHDVENKREELQDRFILQGRLDGMILQAYLVQVVC